MRLRSVLLLLAALLAQGTRAQWANNPTDNRKLILNTVNPVNISTLPDIDGNAFLVWEDTGTDGNPRILFNYIRPDGSVNLRADGKQASTLPVAQEKPVIAAAGEAMAVIAWRAAAKGKPGALYAQRVQSNGGVLWTEEGVQVNGSSNDVTAYAAAEGADGRFYFAYVEKSETVPVEYTLRLQIVTAGGYPELAGEGVVLARDNDAKAQPTVTAYGSDVLVCWTEMHKRQNILFALAADGSGKPVWGREPKQISDIPTSVFNYRVLGMPNGQVFAVWQSQGQRKDIFYQLISPTGTLLLEQGRTSSLQTKGNNTNPSVVLTADSSAAIAWLNEAGKEQNVYVQKFSRAGKPLWGDGKKLPYSTGRQFGQVIIGDARGGVITAWFDRKDTKQKPVIMAARFNKRGTPVWDSSGAAVALRTDAERSYLNAVPDGSGGLLCIFRDKISQGVNIVGQRIYGNGAYNSQLSNFSAEAAGDTVRLAWRASNEQDIKGYRIERKSGRDTISNWREAGFVPVAAIRGTNTYRFSEIPADDGLILYRVSQLAANGDAYSSAPEAVTIIRESGSRPVVYQNIPNPFTDSTAIMYYLPEPMTVFIEVYNSRIEKAGEYTIEDAVQGRNTFILRRNNMQPGVYFYRFTAGDVIEVKKFVVTR